MSTASDFESVQKRVNNIDEDLVLGHICWFYVSNVRIKHTELIALMFETGLSAFLPRPPGDTDVFRRVCSGAQKNRVPTGVPGVYCNYLIRDVGHDSVGVYKRIVKETVDTAGQKLEHDSELCEINFNRRLSTLHVTCTGGDEVAEEIARTIDAEYHAERDTINGQGIRELVRKVLDSMRAVSLRGGSGGVYFVGAQHGDKLTKLRQLIAGVGGNCIFDTHPCMDDGQYREMVRRAFETESSEEIDQLIFEIGDLVSSGKEISEARYKSYLDEFYTLTAKAEDYEGILERSMDTTKGRLKLFQTAVLNLYQNVPAEKKKRGQK